MDDTRRLNGAIGIMAKNPVPGRVKTRLAQEVGAHKACVIYSQLLQHTIHECERAPNIQTYIFHTPHLLFGEDHHQIEHQLQVEGDLGVRMHHALSTMLSKYNRALVIGADCPLVNAEIFQKATTHLQQVDLVLGPTEDGGYYLLGINQPQPYLFENIQWSRSDVFTQTLDRARQLSLSFATLPLLYDIDYLSDWERWLGSDNV